MSDPLPSSPDAGHLRILSICYFVCAGLVALMACIPIIHLVMGLVILLDPSAMNSGQNTPLMVGWVFVIVGAIFIVLGWSFAALVAWTGRCLHRRVHYTFCLVMAVVTCMFMPVGTVLGIFTLMVLLRPAVKLWFTGTTAA